MIKLKPDCALAEALLQFLNAAFDCGAWDEEDETPYLPLPDKCAEARKHLLEVIHGLVVEGEKRALDPEVNPKTKLGSMANEIMGVVSDD